MADKLYAIHLFYYLIFNLC